MVKFDDKFTNARLADLHLEEEERYVATMAPRLGFEYINLRGYTINPSALATIDERKAREANVVGFELHHNTISVGAKDPNNPLTQKVLEELERRRYIVQLYLCSSHSLEHAWKRYKDVNEAEAEKKGVFEINTNDIAAMVAGIKTVSDVQTALKKIKTSNNARRISETLELIFAGAMALGASDIHIEPEVATVRLRYRFDGVLHDIADIESYMHARLISRLKLLSGMVLNTKSEAQDGRFTFDIGDRKVEIRSSVIPGAVGESIVMRILDPSVASFSLDKINLNPYIREAMLLQLKKPNGLIITTGPTGSGKTTALYAFLRETHEEGVKIITIENPVEYKIDGIVQTQTDGDYTFASGLRAILRQDPDIIMIGEIRDREVAETAIHAAQTGHLVFSTLHTNSAVAGFPRLIDLGIDPRIFGSSINVILGQRLVRLLCTDCKEAAPATPEERQIIETALLTHPHPPTVPEPLMLYHAVGCDICGGTGYKGRTGIFEAILMDEAVEEAVLRDPREHVILAAARPQGIPTMVEDGITKVLAGETDIPELERVIELPRKSKLSFATQNPAPVPGAGEENFLSHVV
ncbi:MAG: GspE/PulE family protein [Patescibacteria group bacterium]